MAASMARGRALLAVFRPWFQPVHLEADVRTAAPCRFIHAKLLRRRRNFVKNEDVEAHRASPLAWHPEGEETTPGESKQAPHDYRYIHPEFLPNPDYQFRDKVLEKLERADMYRRRANVEIPEFYVGSILAVSASDSRGKAAISRFVGICIHREGQGLRANFTLRNVIEGQGVEILYDLYSPVLREIEVLKLEKRQDESLFYLRDAPPEYSTVPFDMEPVVLPKGSAVPVNSTKVVLGPRPWHERWERSELKGIDPQSFEGRVTEKMWRKAEKRKTPWKRYDLMADYRGAINDVEAGEVMQEVYRHLKVIEDARAKVKKAPRKRP